MHNRQMIRANRHRRLLLRAACRRNALHQEDRPRKRKIVLLWLIKEGNLKIYVYFLSNGGKG
jgi:hypothetical protein